MGATTPFSILETKCFRLKKSTFSGTIKLVYTLEPLTTQNSDRWDALLLQCSESTAFQSLAWRDALDSAFKQLTPVYLLIQEDDTVIGGLPAFVFRPIPGIKLWHSLPWNLFGGVFIIDSVQVNFAELMWAVETYLENASAEQGWCERRWTFSPRHSETYSGTLTQMGYERTERFTHFLRTSRDVDALWRAYNKRVRGAVRKAEKSGVTVTDTADEAGLAAFYEMYLTTVKRLDGTPKPLSLMRILMRRNLARLATATYDGTIIAGLLYLHFNRTVTLWCEASVPEFLQYRPNNAIFHYILTWACEAGYDWVDFGASPPENKGLIAHKEQYRAKRFDFCHYTKVVSPIRRALWTQSEGILRKIYARMQ